MKSSELVVAPELPACVLVLDDTFWEATVTALPVDLDVSLGAASEYGAELICKEPFYGNIQWLGSIQPFLPDSLNEA